MSSAAVAHQNELETRTLSVSERAKTIEVRDQATYEEAARVLLDVITPMIAEVHEAYDSIVKKNYEAWQEAVRETEKLFGAARAHQSCREQKDRGL